MNSETKEKNPINKLLVYIFATVFIIIMVIEIFGYFKFGKNNPSKSVAKLDEIVQVDVLNGCGISGVAQKFTNYLRQNNYDVVGSGNYKNFLIDETFLIDRIGDEIGAQKLALTLNISKEKIVTEINPSYFVPFSVVIGKNFKNNLTKKE